MQSMRPKILYPHATQNSFSVDIDELLDSSSLSFLIDKSVKKDFYYNDYLTEYQVNEARKQFSISQVKEHIVPINEMTAKEIRRGADAARLARSKDKRIIVHFETVTEMRGWIRFDVTSQFTPGKHYKVHVKLKEADDIKYFKEFRKQEIIRLFLSGDIQINCTCPDFRYRHRYQAWQMGYGLFKELRYPHIANPGLTGSVCKHCLAVLQVMSFNHSSISKKMINSKFFKRKYEDEEYMSELEKMMKAKKLSNRGRRNSS